MVVVTLHNVPINETVYSVKTFIWHWFILIHTIEIFLYTFVEMTPFHSTRSEIKNKTLVERNAFDKDIFDNSYF